MHSDMPRVCTRICALLATLHAALSASNLLAQSRDEAVEVLNSLRLRIRSFDVTVRCSWQHALSIEKKTVIAEGHAVEVPDVQVRSLKDVQPVTPAYRQVFLDVGPSARPLSRIEEVDVVSGKQTSILTWDGTVRRSFYASQMAGLVGGAPAGHGAFVNPESDYYLLCGATTPGIHRSLSQIAQTLPEDSVTLTKGDHELLIHLLPENPKNAASHGYRIWLDVDHGLMLKRMQRYAITPDGSGKYQEHQDIDLVVSEFHKTADTWVPLRASVTRFIDRGKLVGQISTRSEIVVDASRSSWNSSPPMDLFAYDFPPGARVFNEFLQTSVVVGSKAAGRNLDELVEGAKEMFPEPVQRQTVAVSALERVAGPNGRWLLGVVVITAGALLVGFWAGFMYVKRIRTSSEN